MHKSLYTVMFSEIHINISSSDSPDNYGQEILQHLTLYNEILKRNIIKDRLQKNEKIIHV